MDYGIFKPQSLQLQIVVAQRSFKQINKLLSHERGKLVSVTMAVWDTENYSFFPVQTTTVIMFELSLLGPKVVHETENG